MLILSYLICWRNPATKITIRFCTARGWFGWPWTCCPLLSCRMHRPGRRFSDPFGSFAVSRVRCRALHKEASWRLRVCWMRRSPQPSIRRPLRPSLRPLETREMGAEDWGDSSKSSRVWLWNIVKHFKRIPGSWSFQQYPISSYNILYQFVFVSKERTIFPLVVFRIHSRCSHCMKSWRCESVSLWNYIMNSTSIPSTEM